METNILVKKHRDQEIYYNTETDKFVCAVVPEKETTKTVKRQSLKDVVHEIDVWFKNNANFKPFTVLFVRSAYYTSDIKLFVKEITSVRSDGIFVATNNYGTEQIKISQLINDSRVYDASALEKQKEISDEYNAARALCGAKMKKLIESLTPLDLSAFDYLKDKEE